MSAPSQAGAVGGELLVELDRLIRSQATLHFAKGNYNEAMAEAYGIALLDFMRVHGMELRRIVASSAQGERSTEPVAWRYRWANGGMPWAYMDGKVCEPPAWTEPHEAQHLYTAPPAAVPVEALEGLVKEWHGCRDGSACGLSWAEVNDMFADELTQLIKERSNG